MRHPFVSTAFEAIAAPAPALGQHTRAVLAAAGFGQERLNALLAAGIIAEARDGVPA